MMELTLPGSHNSGNHRGLSGALTCASDYKYVDYLKFDTNKSQTDFDAEFLPWNVNHDLSIAEQLQAGTRYFHLKVCNFNDPDSAVDLRHVFNQHRGYTSESLAVTLATMRNFLQKHPNEFIALGFNNLNQNSSLQVSDVEIRFLSSAVAEAFGNKLIVGADLHQSTLKELAARNCRVAIFFEGNPETLGTDILPSQVYLSENWDSSMSSGNLTAAQDWLRKDLQQATRRDKFYVMQANPNDDLDRMLERISVGGQPRSLKTWEWTFLRGLRDLVEQTMAENPNIHINAVSTDFFGASQPYDLAMRLMGLHIPRTMEVPTSHTMSACLNPAVISGEFSDPNTAFDDDRYVLSAAHVMQRHTDRWIYGHSLIDNVCWPGQKNSSHDSSALMASECDFGTRNLQTVWNVFPDSFDPYAAPEKGACQLWNGNPQGDLQGELHATLLGEMLRVRYVESGLLASTCQVDELLLQSDNVHKNQLTLQTEYHAMCGRLPTEQDYTRNATLVQHRSPVKGEPWYLDTKMCAGARLDELQSEADAALLASSWWQNQVQSVAKEIATATGNLQPQSSDAAHLLDSIVDCAVVHACTGLDDTPTALLDSTGLPDGSSDSLFLRANRNETATRTWPLDYFRATSTAKFKEYSSLYYGYFFAVLRDRLLAAVAGETLAPKLTISVMSDGNISPQLAIYGLGSLIAERPPYLSALIHEVLFDSEMKEHVVRVIYNGKVQEVCRGLLLCPLGQWAELVDEFVPSPEACPTLYENYEFLSRGDDDNWKRFV